MKELIDRLTSEFEDADYAHAYMESHLIDRIAAQIYTLRKQRNWSQQELSERSGVAQEKISKIESGDFTSLTIKTLQKFSRAFDVNLMVSFQGFSSGILDVVKLSKDKLTAASRSDDLKSLSRNNVVSYNLYASTPGLGQGLVTTSSGKSMEEYVSIKREVVL